MSQRTRPVLYFAQQRSLVPEKASIQTEFRMSVALKHNVLKRYRVTSLNIKAQNVQKMQRRVPWVKPVHMQPSIQVTLIAQRLLHAGQADPGRRRRARAAAVAAEAQHGTGLAAYAPRWLQGFRSQIWQANTHKQQASLTAVLY